MVMKKSDLVRVALPLTLSVFLVALPAESNAEYASRDLVIKFESARHAQRMDFGQMLTGFDAGSSDEIETQRLLNAQQGVIHVRFKDDATALRWQARLAGQRGIERVGRNLLYSPALHLRERDESPAEARLREKLERQGLGLQPFGGVLGLIEFPDAGTADPKIPARRKSPGVNLPGFETPGPDARVDEDWSYKKVNPLLDLEVGTPVTTAVIDTGVDYNHEDLVGAMWRQPGNERIVGYDFAHDKPKPYDQLQYDVAGYIACLKDTKCALSPARKRQFLVNPGHGTHCAGHVGAVANNTKGIRGVGTGTRVMALKFFYDVGEEYAGMGDDAAAVRSIDYAVENGARVISASWGGRAARKDGAESEIHAAIQRARDKGVLFVVAAGNDGINQDTDEHPAFPAAYTDLDNMIVVGASDAADQIAQFSNFGPKSVHIAAPGVKVLSTTVGDMYSDVVARFTDSKGKVRVMDWDGTSMAAPIVAGAASLVWSRYPRLSYQEVREAILQSARKVPGLATAVATSGVVDVQAALKIAAENARH